MTIAMSKDAGAMYFREFRHRDTDTAATITISRCVRRAFLLAESQDFDRKAWLDQRLKQLNSIFAVSVAGFSVMDNHLHLLLRIEPETANAWSPVEVARLASIVGPLRPPKTTCSV